MPLHGRQRRLYPVQGGARKLPALLSCCSASQAAGPPAAVMLWTPHICTHSSLQANHCHAAVATHHAWLPRGQNPKMPDAQPPRSCAPELTDQPVQPTCSGTWQSYLVHKAQVLSITLPQQPLAQASVAAHPLPHRELLPVVPPISPMFPRSCSSCPGSCRALAPAPAPACAALVRRPRCVAGKREAGQRMWSCSQGPPGCLHRAAVSGHVRCWVVVVSRREQADRQKLQGWQCVTGCGGVLTGHHGTTDTHRTYGTIRIA